MGRRLHRSFPCRRASRPAFRFGCKPHPRRRHDAGRRRPGGGRALLPAQHRLVASQRNRPHCRHGRRIKESRRNRAGGSRSHTHHPAGTTHAERRYRHLRRPPHGDVLLTGCTAGRTRDHQRPTMHPQNLPRLFRGIRIADGLKRKRPSETAKHQKGNE